MILIIVLLVVAGIIYAIANKSKSPVSEAVGQQGEDELDRFCRAQAGPQFWTAHDLLLRRRDGATSQVDQVVITPAGIFVIEMKNVSGWIFGCIADHDWVQFMSRSRDLVGHYIYNPVWQNRSHVSAIKDVLGESLAYTSVIVFGPNAEVKCINGHADNTVILPFADLASFFEKKRVPLLTDADIAALGAKLAAANIPGAAARAQHVERVRRARDNAA